MLRPQKQPPRPTAVFINCPFDPTYRKIFDAIVFAVCALGFEPCCALDRDDGSEERLTKILQMVEECPFGIHDLSHMKLDPGTKLPRHNMPFELGLFLGCKFATRGRSTKSCLILDRAKWRYRKSLSDLSGRDIHVHGGRPELAMTAVRDWLATESGHSDAPGGAFIVKQYRRFRRQLPELCETARLHAAQLTFSDYRAMAVSWLRINA
ncbi:MAG TPA: hypothetical protein VMI06_03395 [Terriglobia bacterium]|nr:hypothetical protein [Terriglobia bacterium]